MNRTLTLLLACIFVGGPMLRAQQDAQFTKYVFVPLVFNPAYAGARDHLALNMIHRSQWVGINGAPTTQAFTAHTPLRGDRVGVGFSGMHDVIGANRIVDLNMHYAYRIPIGKSKLSIGLNAGLKNWRFDNTAVTLPDQNDPSFQNPTNMWKPNFGVGTYFYNKSFFVGFACPHLVEWDLRENATTAINARQYRHFYGMVGGAIPLSGDDIVFRPMALVKNTGWFSNFNKDDNYKKTGAPTSVDVDLSVFFYETLWIGAAYRASVEQFKLQNGNPISTHDSFDVWASYFLSNGLRIGAAYDYPLTKLNQSTVGSFELMVGYEFDYKTNRMATPRYF